MCLFCVALASLSTFNSQLSTAQSLEWDLRFDTKFDNREYDGVKYLGTVPSITFFSLRLAPAVGIGWRGESKGDGVRHRVMAGVSYTLDMGADAGGRATFLCLGHLRRQNALKTYSLKTSFKVHTKILLFSMPDWRRPFPLSQHKVTLHKCSDLSMLSRYRLVGTMLKIQE